MSQQLLVSLYLKGDGSAHRICAILTMMWTLELYRPLDVQNNRESSGWVFPLSSPPTIRERGQQGDFSSVGSLSQTAEMATAEANQSQEPKAKNPFQVSDVGGSDPSTGDIFILTPGKIAGSWIRSGAVGSPTGS